MQLRGVYRAAMKKILILISYYYPGYRSGGPQRTIQNLAETFGENAEIYIYTQNRDCGTSEPYQDIKCGEWLSCGKSEVMYVPPGEYCGKALIKLYTDFPLIYTCGLFEKHTRALLLLHALFRGRNKAVYVAPMGVFSQGAWNLKRRKKQFFLNVFKSIGAFRNIIWSFTSEIEYKDAICILGEKQIAKYIIAKDLPSKYEFSRIKAELGLYQKRPGKLRVLFVSRICPMKNLDLCLDILNYGFDGEVTFSIYGIIEDKRYWERCQRKIQELPKHVSASYKGELTPGQVLPVMQSYDVFLFPTRGENFGHVIYEALAAGCVPIITDTTPWKELDRFQAGNVIRYGDINSFRDRINEYLQMEGCKFKRYKENAVSYAAQKYETSVRKSGYKEIFGA